MIRAVSLKTAYLTNPIGIDLRRIAVSWKAENCIRQTAFEVRYAINRGDWIYLPKQASDSMATMLDKTFSSRDRVCWQVRLWDETGESGQWSEEAFFEMGLMQQEDWQAKWIMGNFKHAPSGKVRYGTDCFRKDFSSEKIIRARLYVTACGMYETRLNGCRIGDFILAPGSTDFRKRVHYQTYDVTELICAENTWEIELADGFYASNTGVFDKPKPFGYEPKVLAQLELFTSDGKCRTICTDRSWQWSNDGPVRFADMKNGEIVDFNQSPSYVENAQETTYTGIVCCSNSNPAREKERFANPKVIHCPNGQSVLDFGQNIAGYMQACVFGSVGHKCSMVFGERLKEDGNFTVSNIAWKAEYDTCHFQTVDIICNGQRTAYKPRFTVMGFRYVLLRDWPEEVKPEHFTAIAVYSDMDVTFSFDSSDEKLNQIVKNTFWSVKGNFLDVPTDCPTRERAGWTGDAQLFFNTGNFMMDQRAFFRKWLRDVADGQKENGLIYNINPAPHSDPAIIEWVSMEGSAGWGDAMILIPYYFWKRYADDSLIREFWEPMLHCHGFYARRMGRRNVFSLFRPKWSRKAKYLCACGRDFGEWAEPDDCAPPKSKLLFPNPEEATAYLSFTSECMSEMAAHLGMDDLSGKFGDMAQKTRSAYNAYFVQNGEITTNRICKYVRPCGLNLARGEARQKLLRKTVELNRQRNYRIGTGFLTTPFVFEMLSEAGESDDAFRMLMNPEIGWVQQIRQGATTVWENWTPDASLNHYSKGACCQWLFDCICGIRLDGKQNHFTIAPHVLKALKSISFSYDSVFGKVSSGWENVNGHYHYAIEIPANCTADVLLPDGEVHKLTAGIFHFGGKTE